MRSERWRSRFRWLALSRRIRLASWILRGGLLWGGIMHCSGLLRSRWKQCLLRLFWDTGILAFRSPSGSRYSFSSSLGSIFLASEATAKLNSFSVSSKLSPWSVSLFSESSSISEAVQADHTSARYTGKTPAHSTMASGVFVLCLSTQHSHSLAQN